MDGMHISMDWVMKKYESQHLDQCRATRAAMVLIGDLDRRSQYNFRQSNVKSGSMSGLALDWSERANKVPSAYHEVGFEDLKGNIL